MCKVTPHRERGQGINREMGVFTCISTDIIVIMIIEVVLIVAAVVATTTAVATRILQHINPLLIDSVDESAILGRKRVV